MLRRVLLLPISSKNKSQKSDAYEQTTNIGCHANGWHTNVHNINPHGSVRLAELVKINIYFVNFVTQRNRQNSTHHASLIF